MSSYIYQLVTDFIVFKLVDSFANSAICDAANDLEKKRIWFYESGFLAVISLPIYLLDHTPYLLWLLTGCTFLFTQLLGQLHLLYWWNLLKTRWDEHLQHQESLERLQNTTTMTSSQSLQPATPIPSPVSAAAGGASTVQTFSSYPMLPQHPSPVSTYDHRLLSNTTTTTPVVSQQYGHQNFANDLCSQQAAFIPSCFPANNNIPYPHKPRLVTSSHHSNNSAGFYPENVTVCPDNTLSSPVRVHWAHNVLRRRPLRPNAISSLASPNLTLVQTLPYDKKELPFTERLLSVFGFSSKSPPGLENNGQNLCFMNCILQCLARTPFLVSSLSAVDVAQMAGCSQEERQFLSEFISILSLCSAQPQSGTCVLDTKRLKSASQLLKCSLLNEHSQQDAAEFLMWLLTTSHAILNKMSVEDYCKRTEIKNSKLACLKAFYGEINSAQIKQLRMSCQEQIDKASGLDTESYAKIAQRLSDLDWLSYKRENISVIDDLYTGQLVEAYNCSRKGHISVQTQTFAVLPVPIGEPATDFQPTATDVYLEDCFTEFCSVEHLSEQICSLCTKARNEYLASTTAKTPTTALTSPIISQHITAHMNLQTPSAFPLGSLMSPILGNSNFKDTYQPMGLQRTSTPRNFGLAGQKQNLERRCLLHQLPECLIIQLLRFTFDSRTKETKKITTPVSVTLCGLDLKNIVFDLVTNHDDSQPERTYKYDLYAVCVHLSNYGTSSGHYISYCLHTNSKWYKFDDDHVSEVDMKYELTTRQLTENAYLLFYKRT